MTADDQPTMDPADIQAELKQLELAREQGAAYRKALEHLISEVADDGQTQPADEYLIGYALTPAEGAYEWADGELAWQEPGDENLHVQIAVCDSSDGQFVPGLRVTATLVDPDGNEVGTQEHGLMWHPLLYHYGCNWNAPSDGAYTLRVRVDPPRFMRHDQIHGNRFPQTVETEFTGLQVQRG